ncbi:metal ABC transporter permease [Rhodopirellula sp. JC740]|uniref:Metal ABC transporter permease n=1 Tax=Rhodopirellula halodulae TaxID=2894198 RepID=A0ABS8NS57_9BACT|nr:metal ABC transporter permease [Rhodopirellula sp. JC740]
MIPLAQSGFDWSVDWSWQLDGWIVVAGMLCAVSSSLLGCFLVLRRMSLLGDAISHAVLPGLAAAFLISGTRSSGWMFLGAVIVGVLTALLSDWIHVRGEVDEGASMGVVFTTLFAAGLIMIVLAADRVDLDPGCVLYGAIESTPLDRWTISLPGLASVRVPRVVVVLSIVTLINAAFVLLFFKELKMATFDAELATSSGFSAKVIHYVLMTLVAVTAVACFESVGNILVVAMLVVPAATAYLLTDRLGMMIGLACVIGAVSAWAGHIAAVEVPTWFGFRSTTTAGMMAVATGAAFTLAVLFSPKRGLVPQWIRKQWLRWTILTDDVLALLYRMEERSTEERPLAESMAMRENLNAWMADILLTKRFAISLALKFHVWRRRVMDGRDNESATLVPTLTDLGRSEAESLVRSHRLWEQYLVTRVDLEGDRIHQQAHRLEHFTDRQLQDRLDVQTDSPDKDPHGSPIPSANDPQP